MNSFHCATLSRILCIVDSIYKYTVDSEVFKTLYWECSISLLGEPGALVFTKELGFLWWKANNPSPPPPQKKVWMKKVTKINISHD